jgi:hypothetical protein
VYVYALVEAPALKLLLGQTDAVCNNLDAANKILDTFDSVKAVVHALVKWGLPGLWFLQNIQRSTRTSA